MYFISGSYDAVLDLQAHEEDNPTIIKHPLENLYAVKISKENICSNMNISNELSEDWRC